LEKKSQHEQALLKRYVEEPLDRLKQVQIIVNDTVKYGSKFKRSERGLIDGAVETVESERPEINKIMLRDLKTGKQPDLLEAISEVRANIVVATGRSVNMMPNFMRNSIETVKNKARGEYARVGNSKEGLKIVGDLLDLVVGDKKDPDKAMARILADLQTTKKEIQQLEQRGVSRREAKQTMKSIVEAELEVAEARKELDWMEREFMGAYRRGKAEVVKTFKTRASGGLIAVKDLLVSASLKYQGDKLISIPPNDVWTDDEEGKGYDFLPRSRTSKKHPWWRVHCRPAEVTFARFIGAYLNKHREEAKAAQEDKK
jgi:hypothetical protein